MSKPKIAIVHPRLGFGGSEARALWGIDALKRHFDVTLITGAPVDMARLNEYYGTKLDSAEFRILQAPMPFNLGRSARFAALKGAFLQRYVQRLAREFDAVISAYNVCDFGAPGIQFIADFSFIDQWRNKLHPALETHRSWWYGDSPLRRAYLGICRWISPADPEAWKRNLTVANSEWSANLLRAEFHIESRILYPPVGSLPAWPWQERENGFVCVGRVTPEKRMDAVIRILERVRDFGHDVHLHLLGALDDSPFGRKLTALAAARADWVRLEGRTFGERKKDFLAGHRYGISACENEAFGIAAAEMVKAGAITFVPLSGGQQEIVNHPLLTFQSEEEAATKIAAVLPSVTLQESLHQHLSRQAAKFSVENFQAGFRNVVFELLSQRATPRSTIVSGRAYPKL